MRHDEFAIALSQRNREEAIKEVSLKIKSIFPKNINYLIILYTPHYNPSNIIKATNLTLKPKKILGLQSPYLIFGGKLIQKGIIACCINKEGINSKEVLLKSGRAEEIELLLHFSFQRTQRENFFIFSFLSPSVNPMAYLTGVRLSLGKAFSLFGSGYSTKHSPKTPHIVNNVIHEGSVSVAFEGIRIDSFKLANYMRLGKPFTITKAIPEQGIIMEINGQPAINIYRHYLEEKFEIFMKNHLFTLYPLELEINNMHHLINVTESLDDGSLFCLGEIKENVWGHIMIYDPVFELDNLPINANIINKDEEGLVFIINSLSRKKILKNAANEEIKFIQKAFGENTRIIGIYSDYSFSPHKEKKHINMETGKVLVTYWQ